VTTLQIAHQRLHNQHLSSPGFKKAVDVVKWLGAVQAQDYYGAKWALGQRMHGATDDAIEKAFAAGKILRTHVVRPTWHFVAPADIRWLLRLTAPRIRAIAGHYHRKFELDEGTFRRSNKALATALRGGKHLTRDVLRSVVQQAGIAIDGLRFTFMLGRAELDEIICSGPRIGKQFTYALLDERVPKAKALSRDDALAELTRRYFTSRGPATLNDFVWWSGLTTTDARAGLEMVKRHVVQEVIGGKAYWLSSSTEPAVKNTPRRAYLLPTYDEYLVAYKDRSAALHPLHVKHASFGNPVFSQAIVIGDQVMGSWKRTLKDKSVIITLNPLAPFSKAETKAVAEAAERYAAFLGLTLMLL